MAEYDLFQVRGGPLLFIDTFDNGCVVEQLSRLLCNMKDRRVFVLSEKHIAFASLSSW